MAKVLPSFNSNVVVGARYEGTASESASVPIGGHSNKSSYLNMKLSECCRFSQVQYEGNDHNELS